MNASLSATLTNRRSEIGRLHQLVEAFSGRHGVPESVVFAMNLALDEIVTNVIMHGYSEGGEHEIRVAIALDEDVLEATVRDDAPVFNPLLVPSIDLEAVGEDRPIGGLGVHLVRSVMDSVQYRRDGLENVVVMKKALRATEDPPSGS
jgi:anti-sigma regulatory factor (Ser/Thr protein kinase)